MVASQRVITVKALPKQLRFLNAGEAECGYSGAWGAGKSRALCLKTYRRALHRGAREWLTRRTLVSLRATTLRTLLEPEGNLPPVIPEGTYEHNKVDRIIRLNGGGEIVYDGLYDANERAKGGQHKHGSMNVSGLNIDEAVELVEGEYNWARSRVRLKIDGIPLQTNWASNPGPPSHFLAKRFGLALGARPKRGTWVVQTNAFDNFFLPREYLEALKEYVGLTLKRYVLGQWVGSDGLVYDRWDRQRHVIEREGPWSRAMVWIDEGYTNPFVALLALEDSLGRLHVQSEVYERGLVRREKLKRLRAIRDTAAGLDLPLSAVLIDPSAAELIDEVGAAGFPVVDADNAVAGGIARVQDRLAREIDGLPAFSVDPSCTETCREFETYEWKPDRGGRKFDEPQKQDDHAPDAVRYGISHVDGLGFVGLSTGSDSREGYREDDPEEWAEHLEEEGWR